MAQCNIPDEDSSNETKIASSKVCWAGSRGPLWLNIGWFAGDPFRLAHITIGENIDDLVVFCELQILKFLIVFGILLPKR